MGNKTIRSKQIRLRRILNKHLENGLIPMPSELITNIKVVGSKYDLCKNLLIITPIESNTLLDMYSINNWAYCLLCIYGMNLNFLCIKNFNYE